MNYSEYSAPVNSVTEPTEREQQNTDSSNYIFNNYRDQCINETAMGRSNGAVPPCLIEVDSDLRHSMGRKFIYQPDTSSIRTDCYNLDGSRQESCNVAMSQLAESYLLPAQEESCAFNEILDGCAPRFLQVTTIATEPHLLKNTIQPFIRGGMNSRHHGRSGDIKNKHGNIKVIKKSH
jgi:hypothetical protein